MRKSFTHNEKIIIRQQLKNNAKLLIGKYGMKKTSVDMLVDMTNISKGSFYAFYPSKEVLFFELIEDYHELVHKQLQEYMHDKISGTGKVTKDDIHQILLMFINSIDNTFMSVMLDKSEYSYLIRKLPPEVIENHLKGDDELINALANFINIKDNIDIKLISSCFRGIFLLLLHKDELGDNYKQAIKLILSSLIDSIMED